MAVVEQVQGLMEDPKVKQILDRISKDKKGNAMQQIAQEQFLLVVKEEDLFMKFTSLLKMQITIVEMRRIFYWVSILHSLFSIRLFVMHSVSRIG